MECFYSAQSTLTSNLWNWGEEASASIMTAVPYAIALHTCTLGVQTLASLAFLVGFELRTMKISTLLAKNQNNFV